MWNCVYKLKSKSGKLVSIFQEGVSLDAIKEHLSRSLGISPHRGDLKIMKMDEEKDSTSMQGNGHPNWS